MSVFIAGQPHFTKTCQHQIFQFIILCFNDILKVIIILSVLPEFSNASFADKLLEYRFIAKENFLL